MENGVAHTAFGAVPAPGMADGAGRVMVRPEALGFDPSGAPVEIVDIAFGGRFHSVTLSSQGAIMHARTVAPPPPVSIGRASCWERGCQYVSQSSVGV